MSCLHVGEEGGWYLLGGICGFLFGFLAEVEIGVCLRVWFKEKRKAHPGLLDKTSDDSDDSTLTQRDVA